MTLDGISTQTPPFPTQSPAPRSAPPPPLYAGLEEVKKLYIESDVVKVSGDARELNAGRAKQTIGTDQLSANSKQGTRIDVVVNVSTSPEITPAFPSNETDSLPVATPSVPYTHSVSLTREDGNTFNIDFNQNIRIHEAQDGTTSVYFSDTNKTRTYGLDGAFAELEGNVLDATADTIIINTSGKTVQGGSGGNLIFNFANDTEIWGGTGDDTIVLADDVSGNVINTGEGNDTVKGRLITNTSINLGAGDNTVDLSGMDGGELIVGDGNNTINFGSKDRFRKVNPRDEMGMLRDNRVLNASITIGNGNNDINRLHISNSTVVTVGNGKNNLLGGSVGEDSLLTIGDGNNTIDLSSIVYNGIIDVGNGNNSVFINKVGRVDKLGSVYQGKGAQLNIGNGNNVIEMQETRDNGTVSIGKGNNVFSIYSVQENSKVNIGDGHNAISAHSIVGNASMNIGNGNNTVQLSRVQNNATLSMGNGNNSAKVFFVDDNSTLIAGDGHNGIRIDTVKRNGQVQVGDGANDMGIGTLQDEARLGTGDGDNLIKINLMRDTSSATFGTGDNVSILNSLLDDAKFSGSGSLYVFSQYKGQLSEIARQFTERKAQRAEGGLPTTMFAMNHVSYMKGFGNGFMPPPPNTPPNPGAAGVDINFSWSDQYGHWGTHPINKYV